MENLNFTTAVKYWLQSLTCLIAAIALGSTRNISFTINAIAVTLMVIAAIELGYRAMIVKNKK